MKYVKNIMFCSLALTLTLNPNSVFAASEQSGNTNANDAYKIMEEAASDAKVARNWHGTGYAANALLCTIEAATEWLTGGTACKWSTLSVTTLRIGDEARVVSGIDKKAKSWVQAQGFGGVENVIKESGSLAKDALAVTSTAAKPSMIGLTEDVAKQVAAEATKAETDALKNSAIANAITSGVQSGLFYYQASQLAAVKEENKDKKDDTGGGNGNGGGGDDGNGGDRRDSAYNGSGSKGAQGGSYITKTNSSDPCANITSAAKAIDCASTNAAIQRAMDDPRLNKIVKDKYKTDLKDLMGNALVAAVQDPSQLGNIMGGLLAKGTGNAAAGQQLANTVNSGIEAMKGEEEQSKIASSKMSDKYRTSNQAGGGAGAKGVAAPGAPNFNMDGMLGDLFGKKPANKKDAHLGKLNFAAARKEKIPGYGPDAWENRNVSIFERVEQAYQDVTQSQGFDWTGWKLTSNQKSANNNRMPASVNKR